MNLYINWIKTKWTTDFELISNTFVEKIIFCQLELYTCGAIGKYKLLIGKRPHSYKWHCIRWWEWTLWQNLRKAAVMMSKWILLRKKKQDWITNLWATNHHLFLFECTIVYDDNYIIILHKQTQVFYRNKYACYHHMPSCQFQYFPDQAYIQAAEGSLLP